jgi:hypothetical protein
MIKKTLLRSLQALRIVTTTTPTTFPSRSLGTRSRSTLACPIIAQGGGGSSSRLIQYQQERWKSEDRRVLIQSMPIKDMGTQGERELDIDLVQNMK